MPEPFHFAGFAGPRYTQTPDEVFDVLLPVLSGAELKVLLYIIRRTFGWRKDADAISLSQIMHGITRADGTALDHGTGLAKSTAVAAIKGLETMGIIEAVRSKSEARGYESTTYRPRLAAPLSENPTSHVQKSDPPLVRESDIQQTPESTNKNGSDVLARASFDNQIRLLCKQQGWVVPIRQDLDALAQLTLDAATCHAVARRIGARSLSEVQTWLAQVVRA